MKFWKVSAVGNDFVLIHGEDTRGLELSRLSQKVCDRHFGVGSDGLLVLEGKSLRMFNPDGSEDFCGNGLRCAAVHAHAQSWISAEDTMIHHGRPVRVEVFEEEVSRVEIGAATFSPRDVPVAAKDELWEHELEILGRSVTLSTLSTGSTHTVIMVDAMPDDEWFFSASKALENHPLFPERTSTMWVQPIGPNELRMRSYERGAGETQGCGTGSAAAAVVYARQQESGGEFTVNNSGGPVTVHLKDWQSSISLQSKTTCHFAGQLDSEWIEAHLEVLSAQPL